MPGGSRLLVIERLIVPDNQLCLQSLGHRDACFDWR